MSGSYSQPTSITKLIVGDFGIDDVCNLYSFICNYNHIDIKLDFSKIGFLDPGAIAVIKLINKKFPNRIDIINYNDDLKKLLTRIKFLPGDIAPGTIFPLRSISNTSFDGFIIVDLQRWVKTILNRFYKAPKSANASQIEIAAVEMINNVIDHSNSECGGVICGASFKEKKHIDLTIVDFGITIPATLEDQYPELKSDQELIVKALEFGVSRRKGIGHNYGRGLDIIKSYAMNDPQSSLIIRSRNGFVSITQQKLHVRKSIELFNGTIVKLSFAENFIQNNLEDDQEYEEIDL